jgi:H+/Cl- antiporter ClcA
MVAAIVLTGLAAGVGGALLTLLLHLVQHIAFGYTENTFLIGVERASALRRVLAMTLGGVAVGLGWWRLRRKVSAEDVSVTRAIRDTGSRLPVAGTVGDALLQIVTVGVGASLGREGAPRQVGAATAGWIAARLALCAAQRRTLLACGAGAGLAAVYNVPFGGALFTVELLLGSVALRHVVPALVTALVATVVAWPVLSTHPTYQLATVHLHRPVLVWCLVVGPLAGVAAAGFIQIMAAARTRAVRGTRVLVSIPLTFAAVGALAISYPQLLGNGKGPAELALTGSMSLGLAAALVVLKPLATAACLGSGAIGGLLTPALATGAALGVLTGRAWSLVWPGASVTEYAIVGAAALLAATQRAPVTAVVLTLEFTGTGIELVLPMLVAVALAAVTASALRAQLTPAVLIALRAAVRPRR